MVNVASTSKDVGLAGSGGGGNAANIGNQAISAYGNQRTVAPSAGGGIVKTPAQARATANPGSKTLPQRNINEPPANPAYGYTPGGFDDPTIDWQAIYDIFIAGPQAAAQSGGGGGGASVSYNGPSAPATVMQAPAAVYEMPAQFTAPPAPVLPPPVTSVAQGVAGAPEGQKFETFGTPSTFGGFERMRNQRGPLNNASMTPEMLRRAAASRLG